MLFVPDVGTPEERLQKIAQSINRSPIIFPFTIVGSDESAGTTPGAPFGSLTVERAWLQTLAPDAQWIVRAAGRVDPVDANGVQLALEYVTNTPSAVTLGTKTVTGAGFVKTALGPFDVFATGGVPQNESIVVVRLNATKLVSGTASLRNWVLWLELRPEQYG